MPVKSVFDSLDYSTKPKRRRAIILIIASLEHIRDAEAAYMERMPENLQGGDAYDNAELSVGTLTEAIDILMDAY